MDGYIYNDIFETKGTEYLVIIAFLFLLIVFWVIINKRAQIGRHVQRALGVLSSGILKVPQGVYYSDTHTWTHLERSGAAKVGLSDLLLHITGKVNVRHLKNPGDTVEQGELLLEIERKGNLLRIFSPISGQVLTNNTALLVTPGLLNKDPYGQGWIYKIKPSDWKTETRYLYLAEEATTWSARELERFKHFILESMQKHSPEVSMAILQDGGELCDNPLSEMPPECWQDFQRTFLNN